VTTQALESLIQEGIKGLPPENLAEIADFIYFVRKRVLHPEAFADELRELSLRAELKRLSREEEAHLEKEFTDYEQPFPHE
jgi:hypothetical protein